MQRLTCNHTIQKDGNTRQCQRYLGDLADSTLSIKCPRCGGVTHVALQQGVSIHQLAELLGGISCQSPHLGQAIAEQ